MIKHFFSILLFSLLLFAAQAQNQQERSEPEAPLEPTQFQKVEILINTGMGQYYNDLYIENIASDIGVSDKMGYYYSLSGLYNANKRFSMGIFYSELLKKSEHSKYINDSEKVVYQSKVSNQYIAFLGNVNFYLNPKFKLSLGMSMGRTNFFHTSSSSYLGTIIKGNTLSYGFHGAFKYSIAKHWGISLNFNSIFAQLDELGVQSQQMTSKIDLQEDQLNIGKYEIGLGVVFSFP